MSRSVAAVAIAAGLLLTHAAASVSVADLAPCPGEDRTADHKCHIAGGQVCLRLLDEQGQPRVFNKAAWFGSDQDWWDITGTCAKQSKKKWDAKIRANGGDSWCVCAECAAKATEQAGCENMDIRCDATNMYDIFSLDLPGYQALEECLKSKCPKFVPKGFVSYTYAEQLSGAPSTSVLGAGKAGRLATAAVVGGAFFAIATSAVMIYRKLRRGSAPSHSARLVAAADEEEADAMPDAFE